MVTLLRTVGYVLWKVDYPAADVATKQRIDAEWKWCKTRNPETVIFHDFIEKERDNVVHQYDLSARVNVTIQLGGVSTGGISDQSGPPMYQFVMRERSFRRTRPA